MEAELSQPALLIEERTWSIWDLDDDEREALLFLRRLIRESGKRSITSVVLNDEIDKIRNELEAQRERYRAWYFRPWRWREPAPYNPDDYLLPLVATADGWVEFMLALERLRHRGLLIETEIPFSGIGLIYSLQD